MDISPQERDRIIALSALLQAVTLVQQVAETGQVNQSEFETLLSSLLAVDAPSTEAVYGDLSQLKMGLEQLNNQLSKTKGKKDLQLLRYTINLLHLERKLAKRPDMLNTLRIKIDEIPEHVDYFGGVNTPQIVARLADIYHQTISQISPKIHVMGDPVFLQQADNVNRVRALLLAGIRAAMLWQQKGGRRWQFVFQSKKILKVAAELHQSELN